MNVISKQKLIHSYVIMLILIVEVAICAYMIDLNYLKVFSGSESSFSLCHLSEKFNCDKVAQFWASEWFSIPVSWIGFVAYLSMLLLLVISDFRGKLWAELMLYMLLGSVLASDIFLAMLMVFEIKYYCIFCILTYMLTLLLVVLIFYRMRSRGGIKMMMKQMNVLDVVKISIVGVACVLVIVLGGERLKAQETKNNIQGFNEPFFRETIAKVTKLPVNLEDDPSLGKHDSKLTIIEFSDFQCHFCAEAAVSLKPVMDEYKDRVHFVFKNFPLGKACNPLLQNEKTVDLHPAACALAQLGEAAHLNGGFWKLHDYIFAHQQDVMKGQLPMDEVEKLVTGAGLEWAAVQKSMANPEASKRVMMDIMIAQKLAVKSTPTFFFNGLVISGAIPPNVFRRMIEVALEAIPEKENHKLKNE